MIEMLTHADELVAAIQVDHTGSGGPDLSGVDQVKMGVYTNNPLQRPFVCLAPRGWEDLEGQGTLTSWSRLYSFDVFAWARSTKDAPRERITAGVMMADTIQRAVQGAFLDSITPTELYQATHRFRVSEVDILDGHEMGARGPWAFTKLRIDYEVHGRDEVA